jgi:hypothetical protein
MMGRILVGKGLGIITPQDPVAKARGFCGVG